MLNMTVRHGSAARAVPEPTFAQLLGRWLNTERLRVKQSTYSTYAGAVRRHITPALGELPIGDVTPERLSEFLEARKNFAPATMRLVCHVLRAALDYGGSAGMPVAAPSAIYLPHADRTQARILDADAQRRLEAALREHMDSARLGMLLCLYTGIRLGEICALKWEDVAPDGQSLRIRRTVQRISVPDAADGPRTVLVFDTPKSASSNRRIPVPPALAEELRRFRREGECFLLTGDAERVMEPRRFQSRFKTVLRHAGVEDINFHALRHTFATNCIGLGCDPTTLSRILGHSDVAITLNTYVHPSFDSMRAIMERLEAQS